MKQPRATSSVTYRAHVQDVGWQPWVSNGDMAGTEGHGLHIEGLQVKLTSAPGDAHIQYDVQLMGQQWMGWTWDGAAAGSPGEGKEITAIRIKLSGNLVGYEVWYQVHVSNIGWMDWVSDGQIAGERPGGPGELGSLGPAAGQIEALRVKLDRAGVPGDVQP